MSISINLLNKFWNFVKKSDEKRMADIPFPKGVSEVTNLSYRDDGKSSHLLDIYRPEGENGLLPVIIDIHGGGWMYGDKELNKCYCQHLARHGFAVVNISYCLFPDVTLPEPVQDIFAALNYVLSVAEKYNLDTQRIFLTGDSAGGHYTALTLSILNAPELQTLYGVTSDIKIKGAALTCPALDMESIAKIKVPLAQEYVRMFFGERRYKESPLYKSITIKNNDCKNFPPLILNTCDGDFMQGQTLAFCRHLDSLNVKYELINIKKSDQTHKLQHVYNICYPDWEESVQTNDKICDFFKKLC